MLDATTTSCTVSIACLTLIGLASIPHGSSIIQQCRTTKRKYEALTDQYEDEDGEATEQSLKNFSDLTQRLLLILGSAAAVPIAAATAILVITRSETAGIIQLAAQQWLQFASWVCPSSIMLGA